MIRLTAIVSCLAVAACASDTSPAGPSPTDTTNPSGSDIVAVQISPSGGPIDFYETRQLRAIATRRDGTLSQPQVTWVSDNEQVVTVTNNGSVTAVGVGTARIEAAVGDVRASVSLMVQPAQVEGTSTSLSVLGFSVMEYQDDRFPNRWYYAPQMLVTALPGKSAQILQLDLTIPGRPIGVPAGFCQGFITAGQFSRLNAEVYGEWEFTFESDVRAAGAVASARVTYADDGGGIRELTMRGPVVPGALPPYGSGPRCP